MKEYKVVIYSKDGTPHDFITEIYSATEASILSALSAETFPGFEFDWEKAA